MPSYPMPSWNASAVCDRVLADHRVDDEEHLVGLDSVSQMPIDTLEDWEVLLPAAVIEFRALMQLRHRSIHFNITTYDTVKGDALAAILHMRSIIEHQFGSFSAAPWFISGTIGHAFIKKEFENNAFVRTYFLPKCPFVGPLFGMALTKDGWEIYDRKSYGKGAWTDEEFARQYNERDPEKVVHSIC